MFRGIKLLVLLITVAHEAYGGCYTNTVGISNQDTILDSQITATSQFSDDYQAAYGRLNGDRGGGWCSLTADSDDDFLQVDLGGTYEVCGVATQGHINGTTSYVTDFKLSFSSDGNTWTFYQDGNGQVKEFHRNGDGNTIDQQLLPTTVSASFIRFHPIGRNQWNCLRVEVYGTKEAYEGCYTNAVGISNQDTILDSQITATSQFSDDFQAAYGRLNGDRGGGWCSLTADSDDDFLQVDLGDTYEVCGVATQGHINGTTSYVTDYKLSSSSDGKTWTCYQDGNGQVKEFHRNGDGSTVDQQLLTTTVSAKFIRFHPTGRNQWNCLRVEVYGTKETGPVVDGGWSTWSRWGSCNKTCRGGTKIRTRTCTRPPPENGGQECLGESTRSTACKRKKAC